MLKFLGRVFGRKPKRSFKAAISNRLTNSWTTVATPANYDIRRDGKALIARARDLSKNNDYVKRYLHLVRSNVVGPNGIVTQSKVPATIAGSRPGQIDDIASAEVERHFDQWGRLGSPDVTGQHSWVSLQAKAIKDVVAEGEAIFRKIRGWDKNDYGFALQQIDPMDLPFDYNDLNRENPIIMGVEVDRWARPIAYHFVQRKVSQETYSLNGRDYIRVPAADVIHLFLPEMVHQTRGLTSMSSVMLRLNMLEGYEEAAVVGARIAASKMGFFVRDASGAAYTGDEQDSDGSWSMGVSPGEFEELPPGTRLETFDPNHPHNNYGEFVKATLRGVSSGLGVSYAKLGNDLEAVNFSSLRSGEIEDREIWKCLQNFLRDGFVRPTFETFINVAHLAGALTIQGRPPSSGPDRYREASFQGRRWPWVDPLKDAQATSMLISSRLTSRSKVIRDMGDDPQEVWRQLSEEAALLEELGIAPVETGVASNEDTETQGQADANV